MSQQPSLEGSKMKQIKLMPRDIEGAEQIVLKSREDIIDFLNDVLGDSYEVSP